MAFDEDDHILIRKGEHCAVYLTLDLASRLEGAAARNADLRKNLKRCQTNMKFLAEDGQTFLKDQNKLRSEGRWPLKNGTGKTVLILAFKSRALRIYGGFIDKGFVCTEAKITKTQKQADQDLLKRAARKLGELT